MSLTIEVVRGLGDVPGPAATCTLFEDEAVFTQVGRVKIDQAAKGLKLVSIALPGMRTHVRPGRLISIVDIDGEYRCKVKSIQYSLGWSAEGDPYATCSKQLRQMKVA